MKQPTVEELRGQLQIAEEMLAAKQEARAKINIEILGLILARSSIRRKIGETKWTSLKEP